MKYSIRPIDGAKSFAPFEITFTIETEEEYRILHDEIACKIAETSNFIGQVYRAGQDGPVMASGDVPLKTRE